MLPSKGGNVKHTFSVSSCEAHELPVQPADQIPVAESDASIQLVVTFNVVMEDLTGCQTHVYQRPEDSLKKGLSFFISSTYLL